MGKEYSAGNGKKILIGIGIVVFVAILVVVILLCVPPNTYNAVQTLNKTTNNMFLSKQNEKDNYNAFGNRLVSVSLSGYSSEYSCYSTLTISVGQVLEFYNNNLIYATNNKNLKNNYKAIKNNLKDVQEKRGKLDKLLEEGATYKATVQQAHVRNTFIKFRSQYISWLKSNQKAIKALQKAYTGSMGNVIVNNPGSKLVLSTVNDFLTVIVNQFGEVKSQDKNGSEMRNYDFKPYNEIKLFCDFVEKYLQNPENSVVGNYYFQSSWETDIEKCNKFFKLYGEKNYTAIIETCNPGSGTIGFSKTYDGVVDSEGLYDAVKSFLGGLL